MEQKLTNEEILDVIYLYHKTDMWVTRYRPRKFNTWEMIPEIIDDIQDYDGENINKYKLLLTPLSKISDEHLEDMSIILGVTPHLIYYMCQDLKRLITNDTELFNDDDISFNMLSVYLIVQYLISKGYAVPLFFGIDHWANGKTAIQLGIALDKTTIE